MMTMQTNIRLAAVATSGFALLAASGAAAPALAIDSLTADQAAQTVVAGHRGSAVNLHVKTADPSVGDPVKVAGKVKKNHHHRTKVLIQKKRGGHWKKVDVTTTNKRGKFHASEMFGNKSSVKVRAKVRHVGTSPTVSINFTAPQPQPDPGPQPQPVVKQKQVIDWSQDLNAGSPTQGDRIGLAAAASSGLPVWYSSSNEAVAEVNAGQAVGTINLVGPGTADITAHQDGDGSWEPALTVTKTIKVAAKSGPACTVTDDASGQPVYLGDSQGNAAIGSPTSSLQEAIHGAKDGAILDVQGTCSGVPRTGGPEGDHAQNGLRIDKTITLHGEKSGDGKPAYLITQPAVGHNSGGSNLIAVDEPATLTLSGDLELNGWEQDADSVEQGGVLWVQQCATAVLKDSVVLQGGNAGYGGSVYNAGQLYVEGATIQGAYARYGGGIWNENYVSLESGLIAGNSSWSRYGTGINSVSGGSASAKEDILVGNREIVRDNTATGYDTSQQIYEHTPPSSN